MLTWLSSPAWVGLGLVNPDGRTPLETTASGYVRLPADFEYTADNVHAANIATLQWPPAADNWGDLAFAGVWPTATGGNAILFQPLTAIVTVPQYAMPRISAGQFEIAQPPIPTPFGTRTFGIGVYNTFGQATSPSVTLLLSFAPQALCGNRPSAWTPRPCNMAA